MQCWLKLARFRGKSKTNEFLDIQQIHCNVFQVLEEVDRFISRHLPVASFFKQNNWQRIDKPALPVLAVREAIINAICHRCYENQAGYIAVSIFDDRLEIWSNGELPRGVKVADLKRKHSSVLRNKLIANVFYLRGYIEAWGTGTITMTDLCKKHEVPPVKFSQRHGGLLVTFRFSLSLGGNLSLNKTRLSDRQKEILCLLKKSPLNASQLVSKLEGRASIRTIQTDLVRLEESNLIERNGMARAIIWHITKKHS